MGLLPVFLELAGRRCLVVGGGAVAARKVHGLLAAEARVTVISPTLSSDIAGLVAAETVEHHAREYRDGDLAGFTLAFVATDDGAVNAAVAEEGRRTGVWVNAADDPSHCDFVLPSLLRRGRLTVAVGTGGASPALARAVREALEAHVPAEYATLAEVAAEVRHELRGRGVGIDAERWRRAFGADPAGLVKHGARADIKRRLLRRLREPS
ncbi:MAG TPA: bifunctional precorrin-2 dehydrogenase/sirohydrochlorin ferrochelatase [Methylomirabilota bacterium]|jgi:siroheme synthase-like protein